MVQITKQDEINAYRIKRDKMLEAKEKGMDADDILFVFKMSIPDVINKIATLSNELMFDITTYSTADLKEQKAYQDSMNKSGNNIAVIFTQTEIIQELKRRAEDIVNNKIRFTEDYGETTPAICAATSF